MIGGLNTIPLHVGGGPNDTELAYQQLRDAVGEGGSAKDDSGIDGLWRMCRAHGVAAGSSAERRAAYQAFPQFATDLIPYHERILRIAPRVGAPDSERRDVITERWYEVAVASVPDLDRELKKIDERLSILESPYERSISTEFGRVFQAYDSNEEGPAFNLPGSKAHTEVPNYSTHQVVRVRFTLGYAGVPVPSDRAIISRVRDLLRRTLPSDTTFSISTGPWLLGVTPIGLGALS